MPALIDITGQRFGRLTVVSNAGHDRHRIVNWLCRCDCGNTKLATGSHLRRGNIQSCGCLNTANHYRHGGFHTRLYGIWATMKYRCSNPNAANWQLYGGRGITVCSEWKTFVPFRDWALANSYANHLSIDRIDSNGPYSSENCRWATLKEQNRNCRSNRPVLRSDGRQFATMAEAAEHHGVNKASIYAAITHHSRSKGFHWAYL